MGLALTPDQAHLLVADQNNKLVVVLTSAGDYVRSLSGGGTLAKPWGLAVVPSTGQLLVTDFGRDVLVVLASISDDTVVRVLGGANAVGGLQQVRYVVVSLVYMRVCTECVL